MRTTKIVCVTLSTVLLNGEYFYFIFNSLCAHVFAYMLISLNNIVLYSCLHCFQVSNIFFAKHYCVLFSIGVALTLSIGTIDNAIRIAQQTVSNFVLVLMKNDDSIVKLRSYGPLQRYLQNMYCRK